LWQKLLAGVWGAEMGKESAADIERRAATDKATDHQD
jgi:hypothetical protein